MSGWAIAGIVAGGILALGLVVFVFSACKLSSQEYGQITVPSRLKGQDNIAGSRSGVAVYDKLNTPEDLDEIFRSTRWESEKLAYVSR